MDEIWGNSENREDGTFEVIGYIYLLHLVFLSLTVLNDNPE